MAVEPTQPHQRDRVANDNHDPAAGIPDTFTPVGALAERIVGEVGREREDLR